MLGAIIGSFVGCPYSFNETAEEGFDLFVDGPNFGVVPHVFSTAATVALAVRNTEMKGKDHVLVEMARRELAETVNESPSSGILALLPVVRLCDYQEHLNGGKGRPDYFSAYNVAHACLEGWLYDGLSVTRRAARVHTRLFARWREELDVSEVAASVVFLARLGRSKAYIRSYITRTFGSSAIAEPPLSAKYPTQRPDAFCRDAVCQAVSVFLETDSFEDAIRLSERCGGTFGVRTALVGAMAEAYYGVPEQLAAACMAYLPDHLKKSLAQFQVIQKPRRIRTDS